MKNRVITIGKTTCEVIGLPSNCVVFINGASHPAFNNRFTSIKSALNRFKQWIKNTA